MKKILLPHKIIFGSLLILLQVLTNNLYPQNIPPIVFVSRNLTHGGNLNYQQMGLLPGMGPYSRFSVVGGSLLIRESNSSVRVLLDETMNFNGISLIDISDPCVHWNGEKIIFAGTEHPDSSWRIYEINSDGSGFRKLTFSNRNISLSQFGPAASKFIRYDDIDPCYLPDGRICFASTRYPSLSFFGYRTTNLYVMNSNGSNLHRITTERNSAEEPSIDPISGKIVFSRWWVNIDMPSEKTSNGITRETHLALSNDIGNMWWAARINPDGSGMELYAGSFNSRNGLHSYKPVIMNDAKLLSIFIPNTAMTQTSGSPGIRWFNKGISRQHHIAGANMDDLQSYNNLPNDWGIMNPPFATDAISLPDGKILLSYSTQVENSDYALYTVNLDGSNLQQVFDVPGKLELNADILQKRQVPPVIKDAVLDISDELPPTLNPDTYFKNGAVRFDCENIFTNAGVDVPIVDAPPLTKFTRIKLFLNFQRTDSTGRDTAILYLNEPIQYSGGFWIPMIPADVPVFDQVVDSSGRVLTGSKGQISHLSGLNFGRPGTGTQCVGCHIGHSFIPVPQNSSLAQFTNTSTSASVTQSSFKSVNGKIQYPGSNVKDRKARNDSLTVNWIAAGSQKEWVNLKWDVPIDVKDFVLYNIRPNPAKQTDIQVNDCEILLFFEKKQVGHISSTGKLSVNGTTITVPDMPKIDEAKIIVKDFTGKIEGKSVAGLAEVETIARISFYEVKGENLTFIAPANFSLSPNYPNPFNTVTTIKFDVPANQKSKSRVKLVVYDLTGCEVVTLKDDFLQPGSYEVEFDGTDYQSGIYFYQLQADGFVETKKMLLAK